MSTYAVDNQLNNFKKLSLNIDKTVFIIFLIRNVHTVYITINEIVHGILILVVINVKNSESNKSKVLRLHKL